MDSRLGWCGRSPRNIPSKLGANDRTHAPVTAVTRGIVEL
jgi:hypothetical protein